MRRDPRLAAARRGDVAADRHAVHRLLVPRADPAPARAASARRRPRSAPCSRSPRRRPTAATYTRPDRIMLDINGFGAQQHLRRRRRRPPSDAVVEFRAGHRAADRRERRTRPLDFDVGAEARHPQPAVLDPARPATARGPAAATPATARGSSRRRRPCRAGTAPSRSPARRGRRDTPTRRPAEPAGPAPIDHHVGSCVHAPSMLAG